MEPLPFTQVYQAVVSRKKSDYPFIKGSMFSLPVAVRREDRHFDGIFTYLHDNTSDTAPRPDGWALFDIWDNSLSLYSRCNAADFISTGDYPLDGMVSMKLPTGTDAKKIKKMTSELLLAYDEIRQFAFEENLSRDQINMIVRYKDLFMQLCYKGHYAFYYALSPAFFQWLRLPLPELGARVIRSGDADLKEYQYQLLILENLQQLVTQFNEKISADSHKERLFDDVHRELQEYRSGLVESLTRNMELDIIHLIDSIGKSVDAFESNAKEDGSESVQKLLSMIKGVQTDLEDTLYRQGVDAFVVPGNGIDVLRQTTVSTIDTADASLDRTVAVRISRGWEKQGRIIRPERISAYVYSESALK